MDSLLLTILVGGGIFFVSFMLGRISKEVETVMSSINTIQWLCENGYIRHHYEGDELILEKIDASKKEA